MTFTFERVAQSLADYLAPHFPGTTFYEDPNQQGSGPPCMFLQQRSGSLKERLNGYCQRGVKLDLVYMENYNLPDAHRRCLSAAERLDRLMGKFPYSHKDETALLHTYGREWSIDQNELHYKFEVRVRNFMPTQTIPMMKMDLEEQVNHEKRRGYQ